MTHLTAAPDRFILAMLTGTARSEVIKPPRMVAGTLEKSGATSDRVESSPATSRGGFSFGGSVGCFDGPALQSCVNGMANCWQEESGEIPDGPLKHPFSRRPAIQDVGGERRYIPGWPQNLQAAVRSIDRSARGSWTPEPTQTGSAHLKRLAHDTGTCKQKGPGNE